MIGTLIFITVLVFFFVNLQGLEDPSDNDLQDILDQTRTMSDELLTPGYPTDWTTGNVVRVGIASNQRIDQGKLDEMALMNYTLLRNLLRVKNDFFMFIDNGCLVQINGAYGIGDPLVTVGGSGCRTPSDITLPDPDTLIPMERLVVYNGEAAKLTIYIWN